MQGPPGPRKGTAMRETGRLHNAGLAVRDGCVVATGEADEIVRSFPGWPRLSAEGRLVTPGLVDCHTHIVWGGGRPDEFGGGSRGETYEEIGKAGGGILSTMRATRAASVKELTDGILRRAETTLACGTTALEIKVSYGLSLRGCKKELDVVAAARKRLRQRSIVTFMGAHALPPGYGRGRFLSLLESRLIPMAAAHPARPQFNDVFCEEGAFTREESERVLQAGIDHGLTPKVHSDEFKVLGGTETACRLGGASADHLLVSGDEQIKALAESNTVAVTLPGVAFYLNKPYANARKMVDSNCAVAVGTDWNPGSSMVCALPFAMGLAVARMGLTPEEALCAVTINAAAALRPRPDLEPKAGRDELPQELGTLVPGAPADFCIWPCESLEDLLYQYAFIRPESVFIAGRNQLLKLFRETWRRMDEAVREVASWSKGERQ